MHYLYQAAPWQLQARPSGLRATLAIEGAKAPAPLGSPHSQARTSAQRVPARAPHCRALDPIIGQPPGIRLQAIRITPATTYPIPSSLTSTTQAARGWMSSLRTLDSSMRAGRSRSKVAAVHAHRTPPFQPASAPRGSGTRSDIPRSRTVTKHLGIHAQARKQINKPPPELRRTPLHANEGHTGSSNEGRVKPRKPPDRELNCVGRAQHGHRNDQS